MLCLRFLLFFWCTLLSFGNQFSYSPEGKWQPSSKPDLECGKHFLCTETNLTFVTKPEQPLWDSERACAALLAKGIRNIDFHGDSYMRQIYAALLITLNGNYINGSISDSIYAQASGAQHCTYHKQFNEKDCGVRQLNHYGEVCNKQITLDPLLSGYDSLAKCSRSNGSVVLFSFGNYNLGHKNQKRQAVNNATLYSQFFEEKICPLLRQRRDEPKASLKDTCHTWWISTHYRLVAYYSDEAAERVKSYNEEMRSFYESGRCGSVNYVDVYNFTAALATNHEHIAHNMSYDRVHWGYEINLLKAQMIINALINKPA